MLSKRDIRYQRGSRLAVVKTVLFFLLGMICTLSLLVYRADHQSFFYKATDAIRANSIIETILFQAGPILLFFFGAGAVPLCLLLFDCGWKQYHKQRFFDDLDHAIASIFLVIFTASCAAAFQADLFSQINPGGIVGQSVLFMIRAFIGEQFEKLFIMTGFAVSALIVTRREMLFLVQKCVECVRYLVAHRIWKKIYRAIARLCVMIFYAARWICHSVSSMVKGRFFENKERDLFEVEYGNFGDMRIHNQEQPIAIDVKGAVLDVEKRKLTAVQQPIPSEEKNVQTSHAADDYCAPSLDIFVADKDQADDKTITKELEMRARLLEQKLERFGVSGKVSAIKRGPVVTVFEYQPSIDSKLSKILALEDDLALALQALSIRIIAPIPGTSFVGFEVANSTRKSVQFGSIIRSDSFTRGNLQLPLVIGQDTLAHPIVVDLGKMPHLLVAGSTGSGKSVALNGMLISLLCRCSPQEMRLVLIDPKRLEFAPYADIGHLMFPIVTDVKKVAPILRYIIHEMEQRYDLMAKKGARNIFDFHAQYGKETLPFIVVIIDELADLMMTAGKDVEDLITRIAQMARAAGIHMIVATQRPSVDVITGLIKVNFPSRISFRVTSKVDSRTILDVTGAEKLLGKGDMLFLDASGTGLRRAHGAYVSDKEIQTIVSHIRSQGQPQYIDESILDQAAMESDEPLDDMMGEITSFLATIDEVSISLLQRRFRIGYNRSARIMEQLEQQGRILPSNGGKMRKVVH